VQTPIGASSTSLTFADDNTAYLSVLQNDLWDILVSRRVSRASDWSVPVRVTGLAAPQTTNLWSWINPAATTLYFGRGNFNLSASSLYRATRTGDNFTNLEPLQFVSLGNILAAYAPVLSADELTLYFRGDVPNRPARIYRASRAALATPFSEPVEIESLRTTATSTQPTWLSPDGCELYFTADPKSNSDIFRARKPK
jgi:hypothetical protein